MIKKLVRPNILALKPYTSARDEFKGEASVFLDANENSLGSATGDWNRYPDPYQLKVKEKLAKLKGTTPESIFLGNGSDEAIDILFRIFCEPGKDQAVIFAPTYGMYEVSANINDVGLIRRNLDANFQLPDDLDFISYLPDDAKLLFICSPNNPSGNLIDPDKIRRVLKDFGGIVVIDEAYIDFAPEASWLKDLSKYPNLVILQTFSKAWGLAALRLGVAYASPEIIQLMNKVKPPYNINESTQQLALQALENAETVTGFTGEINRLRGELEQQLGQLPQVKKLYPSDANFILAEVGNANGLYNFLTQSGIVVRNRHTVVNNCLRITVGTADENAALITAIRNFQP
ncbi:MAG: histidinol-phosphate transaminase [Bacteroidota bacterium]